VFVLSLQGSSGNPYLNIVESYYTVTYSRLTNASSATFTVLFVFRF